MADGWQLGDLALCVRSDWETYDNFGGTLNATEPVPGGVYTVVGVMRCAIEGTRCDKRRGHDPGVCRGE